MHSANRHGESGNALFFILICVALFAALSFAVTQSSRSGSDISRERAAILASEFIQYGTALEQAASRMIMMNGVVDYTVDMVDATTRNSAANGSCTTDKCKLFHPKGGAIQGRMMPDDAYEESFPTGWHPSNRGAASPRVHRVLDVGSEGNELGIAWFGIKKDVCLEINRKLGIADYANIPTEPISSAYTGTLTSFPTGGAILGSGAPQFAGKRAFCGYHNSSWGYYYYHVLWAR